MSDNKEHTYSLITLEKVSYVSPDESEDKSALSEHISDSVHGVDNVNSVKVAEQFDEGESYDKDQPVSSDHGSSDFENFDASHGEESALDELDKSDLQGKVPLAGMQIGIIAIGVIALAAFVAYLMLI